jgi:superfamily II DNA or RNA helicase
MPNVILDWDSRREEAIVISEYLDAIRQEFSIPNAAKDIIAKRYGYNPHTPSRIYAIKDSGCFELGLYFDILRLLQSDKFSFDVQTTELLRNKVLTGFSLDNYVKPELTLECRDYQEECVHKCIKFGSGVILLGTGGGKTLIMATLDRSLRQFIPNSYSSLILLPPHLVEQTYKEFISYGIDPDDIHKWQGNELEVKPIILASFKTLHAKLGNCSELTPRPIKEKENKAEYKLYLDEYILKQKLRIKIWKKTKANILQQLNAVKVVMIDEVHSLKKGNHLNKIIKMIPAVHKFGFTGTLPESEIDKWNIIGKIGPILQNTSSFELRENDFLANVQVQVLNIRYKNPPTIKVDMNNPTKAYNEECMFTHFNTFRNKIITNLCKKFDQNSLIIVDKLDHGNFLFELLKSTIKDKQIYWLCGEVEMKEREVLRDLMEKNSNIVCIAMSKIFSVGVNIKNLHYIIFAQGGKAKVTLVQSIGRGLRKHENKELLVIIDLADDLRYGSDHLEKRIERYNEEKIPFEIKDIYEP